MDLPKILRRMGWLSFTLMWIPFTIMMVSMFSVPSGDYSFEELPQLARYSMIAMGFFFALSMVGLVGAPILSGIGNQVVLKNGLLAVAEIIDISDTGTTINENPVVRFHLRVQGVDGLPFEAETEKLIPRLQIASIQPGTKVQVKYDPETFQVALVSD
jgi:hypothetical protein